MLIAEVEYLRRTNPPNQLEPEGESKVAKYGSEALKSLKNARNQLIRGADGRNGNDIIGPVLTPEAIVITLIERLALGVCGSGKIDIILMYEECLEKLVNESINPFVLILDTKIVLGTSSEARSE